jgi:hypothetical protein
MPWSEERRAEYSARLKRQWGDPDWREKNIAALARPEVRAKMSAAALNGRSKVPEHLRQDYRTIRSAGYSAVEAREILGVRV